VNLLRGVPGHPLHPPLTDATIGLYTGATAFALLSVLGVSERNTATAWWLALVVGLCVTVLTALTGLVEWLHLTRGTELWKTATAHFASMVTATVFFLLAAVIGHGGYADGEVGGDGLVLTLIGFVLLTLGGWLGGSIVFVHGMRVLNLVDESADRVASPLPHQDPARGPDGPERGSDA
jgi:uncharacterized membrane protein